MQDSLLVVDPDLIGNGYLSNLRHTYTVTTTECATVAREFIPRGRPALVITEINLPDGSGLDVCTAAKSLALPSTVLVTTANPEMAPDAILAGCDGILIKPFAPNLLSARVARMLRVRIRSSELRARSQGLQRRVRKERAKYEHLAERNEMARARVLIDWPSAHCPYCRHAGVTSFDYCSLRRSWYACLRCKKVWIAKRQG